MPYPDDPYLRHQQQRWLRHDAHLWIRHDAARWVKPGYDPGEIYPTLKREPDPAKQTALSAELAAEVARGYRLNAVLRELLAEVKADTARRRAAYSEESKYSPSQPRVPAGNPDGGQWTDGGGASRTQSLAGDTSRKPGVTDPRVISDADPEGVRAGDRYAQAGNRRGGVTVRINGQTYELTPGQAARLDVARARAEDAIARVRKLDPEWKPSPSFYSSPEGLIRTYEASAAQAQTRVNELAGRARPVELLQERELGGHAIERHVTSRQAVVNSLRDRIDYARRNGGSTDDMRESSFTSLEAADKLVNATVSEHPNQVNRVVSGLSPKESLHKEFETPTGFEAYARNETSRIILNDTYAVRVVIVPDGRVAKGFRVDTAFPTNLRR